jgi:hypothetical protein
MEWIFFSFPFTRLQECRNRGGRHDDDWLARKDGRGRMRAAARAGYAAAREMQF